MLGQYLIVFREILEAALITAIVLSYLFRSGRHHLIRYVWYGVFLAIIASLSLSVVIQLAYGSLAKTSQLLFEALAAFIAVAVLSSMIYWMAIKGKYIKQEMEHRVDVATTHSTIIGLMAIAFVVVFREGLETVLFLTPLLFQDAIGTLVGTAIGTLTAIVLSYAIFKAGMKINLQKFFYFTSILLILLAAGLAGYGTHEAIEYVEETGIQLGWLSQSAYSLGIPSDSPFHHKGVIGSVFAVMFGYTVNPEWARVIVHVIYLVIMLPVVIWIYKRKNRWIL
ncbi:FTR1 family protein [Candidatus Bathyarchaeota archaeon]|nr:FTR1 family protein [Candidatus Bathyarchaeota archaeon]